MRQRLWLGRTLFVCALLAQLPLPPQLLAAPATVLDEQSFLYHDRVDFRIIGDLRLVLLEHHGQRQLRMEISAVGPEVEPLSGFEGRAGCNLHTALELQAILEGKRRFEVLTRREGSQLSQSGTLTAGQWAPLPQRQLRPDGSFDHHALTVESYPVELIVESSPLAEGISTTELRLWGEPRLRVQVDLHGNTGRIRLAENPGFNGAPVQPAVFPELTLKARAGAHPLEMILNLLSPAAVAAEAPVVLTTPPPTTTNTTQQPFDKSVSWNSRDVEGRWYVYRNFQIKDKPWESLAPGEVEMLERMTMIYREGFGKTGLGPLLAKHDSPAWIRCAVWNLNNPLGHTSDTAGRALADKADVVRAWLEKNPLPEPWKSNRHILEIQSLPLKEIDVSRYLPWVAPEEVLRHLEAPATVESFGDRLNAEPGHVYVHQVLDAMNALVTSGLTNSVWLDKLWKLTGHSNHDVRQRALLTYSYLPPKVIPLEALWRIVIDGKVTNTIREAALMGFSYGQHPMVYVRLHETALNPANPNWHTAVSRLGDVGNEFTITLLQPLLEKWTPDQQQFAKLELDRIRARHAKFDPVTFTTQIPTLLENAAWADLQCGPIESPLIHWTLSTLKEKSQDTTVKKALEDLEVNYKSSIIANFGSLEPRIKEYLKKILGH